MKKKIFSIFTILLMLCSFVGVMPENLNLVKPLTSEAAASDFTAEQAVAWANNCAEIKWNKDVDGVAGVQCVDLILAYYSYLGVDRVGGNATDYQSNALPPGWTRVTSSPQPGDIIVWAGYTNINPNYPLNQYGHIGIVVAVSGNALTTVETNADGIVTHAQKKSRNASYAACFVRPNFAEPPPPLPPVPTGKEMSESEAAGRTIPDGVYHIMTGMNTWYGLADGGRATTENGTNVFLNNWSDSIYGTNLSNIGSTDTWKVIYNGNGFYRIQQNGVNVSLDVKGADLHRGTNVQAWKNNDSTAQQWSIRRTDHGYTIQARCSGYYLDVSGGVCENGRNIQVWEGNDTKAQSWCFIPAFPEQTIADGLYRIHTSVDDEYVLDASGNIGQYKEGSNIQIYDKSGDNVFQITHDSKGYYYISEVSTGLILGVDGTDSNCLETPRNVALYGKTNQRNKKWAFFKKNDGTYYIISQLSGYALDLAIPSLDVKLENGNNVTQYPYHGKANQCWRLEPVELKSIKVDQMPDKTTYFIDEKFNPAGIIVNGKYSGDYSFKIAKGLIYDYDFSTPGEKTVTVTYECNEGIFTDSFKVTVNDIDFKGSGTKSDPYLIENKSDLEKMRDLINSEDYAPTFRSCYYLQTTDIDLKNEKWIPIGKRFFDGEDMGRGFAGHFDGGNHTIKGLYVNENSKFAGLFGSTYEEENCLIENLAVEGTVINTTLSTGGIVGEIGAGGTVRNCCFIGDVTGAEQAVGGIVGYLWQYGKVENCYHIGKVTCPEHSAGGIVGRVALGVKSNISEIKNCYHVGKILGIKGSIVSVIEGNGTNDAYINIINCFALSEDGDVLGLGEAKTLDVTLLKSDSLKKSASLIGESFADNLDSKFIDGYPIFTWQLKSTNINSTEVLGDLNGDNKISVADIVLLQKYLTNKAVITENQWKDADLNSDGKVNVFDVVKLKKILLNA